MRYQRAELPLKLDGLAATRKFFAGCMADGDPTCESLWVAHVDNDAQCVHVERYPGDEAGASFPLRAIIADAAQHGSAGIVLAHNHPSGQIIPSEQDKTITKKLKEALKMFDISLLDHLIIGDMKYYSFSDDGMV